MSKVIYRLPLATQFQHVILLAPTTFCRDFYQPNSYIYYKTPFWWSLTSRWKIESLFHKFCVISMKERLGGTQGLCVNRTDTKTTDCNGQTDRTTDLVQQIKNFNQIDFSLWLNPADIFLRAKWTSKSNVETGRSSELMVLSDALRR